MPRRYDPFANNNQGGYVDDPLDEARATLARADEFSRSVGADERTGESFDPVEAAPQSGPRGIRRLTEALSMAGAPLGLAGAGASLTGAGASIGVPFMALSGLMAAPDIARRFIAPDEDESRGGAALEAGLYGVGSGALGRLKTALRGAKAIDPLEDIVRGADMYSDVASRAGGLPATTAARATRGAAPAGELPQSWKQFASGSNTGPNRDIPRILTDEGLYQSAAQAGKGEGYLSSPGMWDRAARMGDETRRKHPGLGEAWDAMSRESEMGLRNVPGASPVRGPYSPYPQRKPSLSWDELAGEEVDLSSLAGGRTEAARRAQEIARAWKTNRPLAPEF